MHFSTKVQKCRVSLDLSYRELGELTCASHTQVRRWANRDAQPTALQEAVLDGLRQCAEGFGGKAYLLDVMRKRGYEDLLRALFCHRG